ncbi:MAG: nucleotidyltransferase family protein [Candidatus Omnitrophica bacterium]|nr:nucleotidyltransferase family protein [Candidatus Omnitrophota bacterium]
MLKRRAERLLLLSLQSGAKYHEEELRGLVKEGIDFEYLVRTAREKGVSSLLYQSLKFYTPANDAEKKALHDLCVSYLTTATANNHYREELIRILAIFRESSVEVIPLKGITLAERLYGDITSRDQSVDVDLLVREKDKERARNLLESMGYFFTPLDEQEEYKWCYAFHRQGQKMVELHWDITMMVRSPERIEGLWQGTENMMLDGAQYLDFEPEELLLYLSAHLVNSDSFRKLKCICDINRLIEKYQGKIDRDSLAEKAREWNMRGSLYTALKLNHELFGFKIPQELSRRLNISAAKRVFISLFANKTVIFKKDSFRRYFLDVFLSYILLELVEAASLGDFIAIVKRLCLPHFKKY